jgi:2-C-methyl-D-erythritol 2,4-cyclodiphosphate synthase
MRIGLGYDIHRLVKGRALYLGGISVPWHKGELGHSDGDVLLHALIDALLGAAAMGDIGTHFPPSDPQYKNTASSELLVKTLDIIRELGYTVKNLDGTIILEQPKLLPYVPRIRENIARLLGMDVSAVSIKCKTKEGLESTGREQAVEAQVAVLLD